LRVPAEDAPSLVFTATSVPRTIWTGFMNGHSAGLKYPVPTTL
jgi:hypothetical protein